MSAAALADAPYRLFAAAVEQHPAGSALFNVSSHEFAEHKALLYVYLDRKICRSTQASEARRVNSRSYRAGDPYFQPRGTSTKKQGVTKLWEHGRFYKAFNVYAGGRDEREYVCAYLETANSGGRYVVTTAHALAHYTVTN